MGKPEEKLCPLCRENNVSGIKSHILSQFLTDEIRDKSGKPTVYNIDDNAMMDVFFPEDVENPKPLKPKQDYVSERYLLCSECEHFIGREIERPFSKYVHKNVMLSLKSPGLTGFPVQERDIDLFHRFWLANLFRLWFSTTLDIGMYDEQDFLNNFVRESLLSGEAVPKVKLEVYIGNCVDLTDNQLFVEKFSKHVYFIMVGSYLVLIYLDGWPVESRVLSRGNPVLHRLPDSMWTEIVFMLKRVRESNIVKEVEGIGAYEHSSHHLYRILKEALKTNPQ